MTRVLHHSSSRGREVGVAIYLLSLLLLITPCFADPDPFPNTPPASHPQSKEPWQFYLSPYFWYAGLSGHVNILGNRVTFSNSITEIRHDLDTSIGAHFEASHGLWSLLLDSDYVKITQTPALGGSNSKTTYETTITDLGAFYNLYSLGRRKGPYCHGSFELFGGGRIGTFHTVIVSSNLPSPLSISNSISDSSSFIVPLIGARFKYQYNPEWRVWLGGDFGGFEMSHVNSTWSAILGLAYQFSENLDVSLAYKAVSVNYSLQAVTINTFLQGPMIGLGIHW